MATSENFLEEECRIVYWNIKNFSYCCQNLRSPVFCDPENDYHHLMQLQLISSEIECCIVNYSSDNYKTVQISFLTCDGSADESISGAARVRLKVAKNVIFGNRRNAFLPEDTLTVELRLPTDSGRGKFFIYSQIAVKRQNFLWTFENLSTDSCSREKRIENSDRYGRIKLILKPMSGLNSTEQFSLEITRSYGTERCYCVFKVSVLDVDGKSVNEVCDVFTFDQKTNEQFRGFPSIIKKSKWVALKNMILKDDKLSLKCFFALSPGTTSFETSEISYCDAASSLLKESDHISMAFHEKKDSFSELRKGLKNILLDEIFCDTSIQIGNEVINVHKSILSARSPVFKAMFTRDMKEKNNNTVVIEDIDLDTMRRLLLYIYTNTIHHDQWKEAKELYIAANKYEVLNLKNKCASFLKSNLSVSEVSEALVLADLYEDEDLKAIVHDYISENDSAVFYSNEWAQLEKNNSALAFRTMREICCSKRFK